MAKSKWSGGSDPLGVFNSGKRSEDFVFKGWACRGCTMPTSTGRLNEEEKKPISGNLELACVSVPVTFAAARIRGAACTLAGGPRGALFLSAFIFSFSLFAQEFRGLRERTSVRPSIHHTSPTPPLLLPRSQPHCSSLVACKLL